MFQVVLPATTSVTDDGHVHEFIQVIKNKSKEAVKVYETVFTCLTREVTYTFLTASKQLHLDLGLMGWKGQLELTYLLESEFKKRIEFDNGPLMLIYPNGGLRQKEMLIARSHDLEDNDCEVEYTLSPIH